MVRRMGWEIWYLSVYLWSVTYSCVCHK